MIYLFSELLSKERNQTDMKVTAILVLFSLLFVLPGCFFPVEEDLLPPNLLKPEEIKFLTIEVERGTIQDILEDAVTVSSSVHYSLSFHNRSGYLLELNATTGKSVTAGEILARLDTGSLETDIIRQKIEVEKRTLSLEEVRITGGSRYARRFAELDLQLAELTLAQLEDDFEKSMIIAPIDGEVVFLGDFKIGGYVPGRSVIFNIADPTKLQFEYTGNLSARIRHGMEAQLRIGDKTVPATVTMTPVTAPAEDRERYRNTVILVANNADDLPDDIRRGSRHRFSIFMEEKTNAIVIPVSAMSTFMGQTYVQILENGMRTERDIDVGIRTDTHVEVLNGINEGDLLIVGIER